jgi:hypothetical protein
MRSVEKAFRHAAYALLPHAGATQRPAEGQRSLKMKRSMIAIVGVVAGTLMVAGAVTAKAATVDWEGLTWTIRGTANSATVQGDGSIDISVLPGNSADPGSDNWALTALLPTTTQWVQFRFFDETGAYGATVPRAYVDTSHNGGSTLIQGGGYSEYPSAYINRHWVVGEDWLVNEWINLGTRTANSEHAFLVGRRPNGSIDLYYDGVLKGNVTDVAPPYFRRVYLGVQAADGIANVVGTYTDFTYGDTYVPEPATMALLAAGGIATLLRRRRSSKK